MRDPKPESSDAYRRVAELWQTILVKEEGGQIDERLRQPRFQRGHMLAMFWETCGPWMAMRARRDARALLTPLFCLQAADRSSPPMQKEDAAKLLNHYNPHETGGIHGMLLLHLGMRIRLTDFLSKSKGLVKDAEGTVVRIVVQPRDEDMVPLHSRMLPLEVTPWHILPSCLSVFGCEWTSVTGPQISTIWPRPRFWQAMMWNPWFFLNPSAFWLARFQGVSLWLSSDTCDGANLHSLPRQDL